MKRFIPISIGLIVLSGCASTARWQHPQRAGDGLDGMTMAVAECESWAAGRSPMPRQLHLDIPAPAPSSYSTTGTYITYGGYGSFQGTTTPNHGFASGLASGISAGNNMVNAYAYSAAISKAEELTKVCMRTLGWIDTSSPEGLDKFQKETLRITATKDLMKTEKDKWVTAINTFLDAEAAKPDGIDYRRDNEKYALLDKYVKLTANVPKNAQQSPDWLLKEGHRRVLFTLASRKRWADAYQGLFDWDASREDSMNYRTDEQKRQLLEDYVDKMLDDPAYDDWKELAIVARANEQARKMKGLQP